MSAEVIASIEIPGILHADHFTYPKDARTERRRLPYSSKLERHQRALWHALHLKEANILEALLDNGINPNLKLRDLSNKFTTALHIAIENGHELMTSLLLSRDANCDVRDGYGRKPLDIACKKRNFKLIEILIRAGAPLCDPTLRISCLGLTFYNMMSSPISLDSQSTNHTTGCPVHDDFIELSKALLDSGFERGWNGINCSYAYLNRVYNRNKCIFLLILQAADDSHDEIFTRSCFSVLYRRRDGEILVKLHRFGYSKMVDVMVRRHNHTEPGKCRLEKLAKPCPLMGMCRVRIRQELRRNPGKISEMIRRFHEIPVCIQKYLDFMDDSM